MGNRMKTLEEVKEFIKNLGYELLSKKYLNNHTKLVLRDKEGYLYLSNFDKMHYYKPDKFNKLNPYTIRNIKLWLKLNQNTYRLISNKYEGSKKKLIFKDNHGYYYNICLNNLMHNNAIPDKFNSANLYTLHNIKLWCKLNNKPFELIDGQKYKGNKIKLNWRCLKEECGEIFKAKWADIINGNGCGVCDGRQVTLSNCLATKNPELAKEWHLALNGDLTPYDITCGSNIKVWWQCLENDNHKWESDINDRSNGGLCPECNKSRGEKKCQDVFIIKNIIYIPQKEFDGLIGLRGGNLSYDFYLPKYNLLIEYQGEQHERPIDFYGKGKKYAKEQFEKQKEHDKRKKEYTINNGYNFLEIWYYDFNDIENILDKYLSELELNNN